MKRKIAAIFAADIADWLPRTKRKRCGGSPPIGW
jgi:hypothetical protein